MFVHLNEHSNLAKLVWALTERHRWGSMGSQTAPLNIYLACGMIRGYSTVAICLAYTGQKTWSAVSTG